MLTKRLAETNRKYGDYLLNWSDIFCRLLLYCFIPCRYRHTNLTYFFSTHCFLVLSSTQYLSGFRSKLELYSDLTNEYLLSEKFQVFKIAITLRDVFRNWVHLISRLRQWSWLLLLYGHLKHKVRTMFQSFLVCNFSRQNVTGLDGKI